MFISSLFKTVSKIMSNYEEGMNHFYKEVGKLDAKSQISILSMMQYRR